MNIKRKLLSFWLVGIMALTILPLSAFADGEAAETPPLDADGYYLLDSPEDLYWFSGFVNGRSNINDKVNARLAADIDLNPGVSFAYNSETGKITAAKGEGSFHLGSGLNGTTLGAPDDGETPFELNKWTPIGKGGMAYVGTFDGNGHTVNGVYVNDKNIGYAGFFGLIGDINANNKYSGYVKNLTIGENSLILGYKCGESGSTGGVAATAMSIDTLENCINRATVAGKSSYVPFDSIASRVGMVGGIVGCMAGKAENCENYGTVISDNYAGGIAGNLTGGRTNTYAQAYVSLENCRNYGEVYGNEAFVSETETSGHAGGIVGNSGGGSTSGCDGGIIAGCVNFGKVRASGAAGIVYQAREGTGIQYCANRSEVAATMVAVGLVGQIDWGGCTLESSYTAGNVTLNGKGGETAIAYPIAGIVKYFMGQYPSYTVKKCYNDNDVFPCDENGTLAGANINMIECYSVATSVFASGEPAYKMGSWYGLRWKQDLPIPQEEGKIPQTYPDIIGTRNVYKNTRYCCHTDSSDKEAHKTIFYSNREGNITDEHIIGAEGFCTHCKTDFRTPNIVPDSLREATTRIYYDVDIKTEGTPTDGLKFDIVTSENDDTEPERPNWLHIYKADNLLNLYGTPNVAGTFTFTVKATNANGSSYKTYTLRVNENPIEEFAITTNYLPHGSPGKQYEAQLETNSKEPKAQIYWSIEKGYSLPTGLVLDEKSGKISGIPEVTGRFILSVTAERIYGKEWDIANKKLILNVYDDTPPVYENSIVYDGRTVFVICEESGIYTVAFANYDKSGKLSGLKTVAQEFAQGYNTVSMPNGMQLSAGSRLFLLESIETMKPMCRTFTVDDIKK